MVMPTAQNLFITKSNILSPLFNDQSPKNVKKKQFNHHQIKLKHSLHKQFKYHQIEHVEK